MIKIAGILYILQIIIIYAVILIFETKYFIKTVRGKNKNDRKEAIKELFKLIITIPIMPLIVLKYFLESEYNL